MTEILPVPLPIAFIPAMAPATAAAVTAMPPPPGAVRAYTPTSPAPFTAPVALIMTAPVPLLCARMPMFDPVTEAAEMRISSPPLSLTAWIPSPPEAVTEPLTLMEIAPPPLLRAMIASLAPLISRPPGIWLSMIPAEVPDWVIESAAPDVSRSASALTMTTRDDPPLPWIF